MKTKIIIAIIAAAHSGSFTFAADSGVPKGYPLKKCPVSNEEFGGDMTPVKATHGGTDVWLCCKNCKKKFDKDPAKYAKMVKDATAKK